MRFVRTATLLLFIGCGAVAAQQPAPAPDLDAVERVEVPQSRPTTTPVIHEPAPPHGFAVHLRPGDLVRFDPSGAAETRVATRVTSVHPRWVAFAVPGQEARVYAERLEAFEGIQISQGRSRARSARWGAAWGAYVGGAAGAIAGPLSAMALDRSVGSSVALMGIGGGVVGVGVGALAGALLAPVRWRWFRLAREL